MKPIIAMLVLLTFLHPAAMGSCRSPMAASKPTKVLALNQTSIENMLRLDLQNKLVATAFPDDAIPTELADKLESVPQIAELWPSREQVLALQPDFIYAGFPSAFGKNALGAPQWWQAKGIDVLINPYTCESSDSPIGWDQAWTDLFQLSKWFNVTEKAKALKMQAEQQLPLLTRQKKPKVLLLDVYSKQARVGACCGGTDLLIRLAGGINLGNKLPGRWASLSWEAVAKADPDIIILATFSRTSTAAIEHKLTTNPLLARITAVKKGHIIKIPFTATLASPRIIEGIISLNSAMQAWQ